MKFKIDFEFLGDFNNAMRDPSFSEFEADSGAEAELLLYKKAVSACEYFNLQAQSDEDIPGFFTLSMASGDSLSLVHWVEDQRTTVGHFRLYKKVENPQTILEVEITKAYLSSQMRRWVETYGPVGEIIGFRIEVDGKTKTTSYIPTVEGEPLGSFNVVKEAVCAVEEYLSDTYG